MIVKTIGHVSSEWRGRDIFLRCNNCGQTEQIADYAGGGKPRLFGWSEAGRGQFGFSKCHQCLMVYDRSADEPAEVRGVRRPVYR
ncbi:MAG TPA: hypothetical protein VIN75_21930 [Burkholderiaceae bacterium]